MRHRLAGRLVAASAGAHLPGMTLAPLLVSLLLFNAEADPMTPKFPFKAMGPDPCHAERFAHLIGQPPPGEAELAAIRAGENAPGRIRVIRPGEPVTMDHQPTRLNVEVGPSGLVERLRCG